MRKGMKLLVVLCSLAFLCYCLASFSRTRPVILFDSSTLAPARAATQPQRHQEAQHARQPATAAAQTPAPSFEANTFVTLSNGVQMPLVGFGTAGGINEKQIQEAIAAGYRHIDTAADKAIWYRNEKKVGDMLAAAGTRNQTFVTTKLYPQDLGYQATKTAFQESLQNLQSSYIDLFLIHYPQCWPELCPDKMPEGTWLDSWRAMEEEYAAGRVRAIGVCNVGDQQLSELLRTATVQPHVVQSWFDPLHQERHLRQMCASNKIVFEGYSTLGGQYFNRSPNPVTFNPTIVSIADRLHKSVAQVVVRWAVQLGVPVLPRSSNTQRIRQNLDVFTFSLTEADMAALAALDGSLHRRRRH